MSQPCKEPRRCGRLAEKRARPAPPEPSPPIPSSKPKGKALSNAERVKAYRQRVKEDPEKYQRYLDENKEKCKAYRKTLSDEKKAEQRVKATLRKQKERQRKKECQKEKMQTRTDILAIDSQRAKWREQKRQQAEKMHWRTREKRNERRRFLYQQKKQTARENNSKSVQCEGSVLAGHDQPTVSRHFEERSPEAQRKALQRARCALPKSPRKFVSTVATLIDKASPRKKQLFAQRINQGDPAQKMGHLFMNACLRLRHKQLSADRQARRVLLSVCKGIGTYRQRSAMLGVHWTTVKRHEVQKEKTKKLNPAEEHAKQFFEESARTIPDKKLVSRKTGKAAAVLQKPIRELYQEFCTSGQQISFSRFAKCRPANIRLMAQAKLRQCLCEYCTNLKLKLDTLNSVAAVHDRTCWIRHERHAVALITCDPNNKACCYGECGECGLQKLDHHVGPLLSHAGELTWHCWESKTALSHGKRVNRKFLATKKGNIQQLVSDLRKELTFLAQHLFRADWQLRQFSDMRKMTPFPSETVCMVMDFAENFACTYQDEIQAAHWHHDQVTVHPTVTYYRCPRCNETTTESLVFISPDKKHDHHAVQAFTLRALSHLREARGLTISHLVQWTDGCASQYKSKGPFADIASSLADFDATLERNFFGSRHGKSPSDGESAVVKHHVSSAVVAKKAIIANAWDMFQYCQSSSLNKQPPQDGCSHFLRSFFWVGEDDIQRPRPHRNIKTVAGTRSFHSVRCIEQNSIHSRHLTCMCMPCQTGVGHCPVEHVVGSWVCHDLHHQQGQQEQPQSCSSQQQTQHVVHHVQSAPGPQCSNASVTENIPVFPHLLEDSVGEVEDSVREVKDSVREAEDSVRDVEDSVREVEDSVREVKDSVREVEDSVRDVEDSVREVANPVCVLDLQGFGVDPFLSLQPNISSVPDHPPSAPTEDRTITMPSVVTLPAIDTTAMSAGDVVNVHIVLPPDASPGPEDIVPSSSVETSPASSHVLPSLGKQQMDGKARNTISSKAPVSHPLPDPETLVTEKTQPLKISHLKVNHYVEVAFPRKSGQKMEHYIGKIKTIDAAEEDIAVSFMKYHPSGYYYTWPEQPDLSWVKIQEITKVLGDPWIDGRGHYSFSS